jgi:metal-responsive CopG/Arc/MetJ family transcriptional regulator
MLWRMVMAKKVIQVPIDEELLEELDNLSQKQRKARAEVIRNACLIYLKQIKEDYLDNSYRQGYLKIPEKPDTGKAQIALSGELFTREEW